MECFLSHLPTHRQSTCFIPSTPTSPQEVNNRKHHIHVPQREKSNPNVSARGALEVTQANSLLSRQMAEWNDFPTVSLKISDRHQVTLYWMIYSILHIELVSTIFMYICLVSVSPWHYNVIFRSRVLDCLKQCFTHIVNTYWAFVERGISQV